MTRSGGRLVARIAIGAATIALLGSGGAAVALTQRSTNAEAQAVEQQSEAVAVAQDERTQSEADKERAAQMELQASRYLRAEDDMRAGTNATANDLIAQGEQWIAWTQATLSGPQLQPLRDAIAATQAAQAGGTTQDITAAGQQLTAAMNDVRVASYQLPAKSNGALPASALCPIPFSPAKLFRCSLIPQLVALNEAYKERFGRDMYIDSAYRTIGEQSKLAATTSLAADPGQSNHGWGMALDIGRQTIPGYGSTEDNWLSENGPRFGLQRPDWAQKNGSLPEQWHWEFTAEVALQKAALGQK